jgi:hypothetical protein
MHEITILLASAANGFSWPEVLSAFAFVLTAVLGLVWQGHARAARRFNAALDAYARQEIARHSAGSKSPAPREPGPASEQADEPAARTTAQEE